jgi:DnaD/phage-associated family protein
MAWIELHQSLPTHRKTMEAADLLNISPVQLVGHMTCFWLWALDNAPDGRLEHASPRTISRAAQWSGDCAGFVDILEQVGFLERAGDGVLEIHDWWQYGGKLTDKRAANAARQREFRLRKQAVTVTSRATLQSRNGATVENRTVENSTQQNNVSSGSSRSLPREDETTTTTTTANAFSEYENGIARPTTPTEAEMLKALIDEHTDAWVCEAIREAVAGGKWRGGTRYLESILARWKAEGYKTRRKGNGINSRNTGGDGATSSADEPDRYAYDRAYLGTTDISPPGSAALRGAENT